MKKEFIRLSATLCGITLVAALLLAGVNKLTKDKIVEAENAAAEEAMKTIISNADEFESLSDNVFEATSKGEKIGYCVKVKTAGFAGEIEMMVGFDTEDKVMGIDILSHGETAGLGAKADDDDFKTRFAGKSSKLGVVKTKSDKENEVQAITGATITSNAVVKGVETAFGELEKVRGGIK